MGVQSKTVLLVLMAFLLAACATPKRNDGAAPQEVGMGKAMKVADGDHGEGIAHPDGAGDTGQTQAGSMTSARFQRVADGIHDVELGLLWAEQDNGNDVSWSDARQYCAARGPDWSLPSAAALRSLFDPSGEQPRTVTVNGKNYTILVLTPLISLSSLFFWSGEEVDASEALYVDFVNGTDAAGAAVRTFSRALCVRRS
jgi:hypothetical protein